MAEEKKLHYEDPIRCVKGIGEKTAALYERLNITDVGGLLEYFPRNYTVYGEIHAVSELQDGKEEIVEVTIASQPSVRRFGKNVMVTCMAHDDTGTLRLTWFHMPYIRNALQLGRRLLIRGSVTWKGTVPGMAQGRFLTREEYLSHKNALQPVYALTFGLGNAAVSKAEKEALRTVEFPQDYLSAASLKKLGMMNYAEAVRQLHFPDSEASMLAARRRLAFDDFFLFTLSLRMLKEENARTESIYCWKDFGICGRLLEELPYQLTDAQKKVWQEIQKDLSSGLQMNRLIQGDVGSGKTILAALSLAAAAGSGCQGCMMAPTEVLAKQHYEKLTGLFAPLGVKTVLLLGQMPAAERRAALQQIADGEAQVVIGTHALISEPVVYHELALVITDEQHRFGVKQRESLAGKGKNPHVIVMSATPIPRTLAMILYGDLDISVVDQMPAGRLPVKNCVTGAESRLTAYEFLRKQTSLGHQAYVICPMVEESEEMEGENVLSCAERLNEYFNGTVRIGVLHGRMKPAEKEEVMAQFSQGFLQVLVSTTVVEVGVDCPNATAILIENAERFGLAELHQLRGRVGRGSAQSYCILLCTSSSKEARERLEILNHSNDGFYIAEQDLKLRGPGDFFGIRQSGLLEFSVGDIFTDAEVLKLANETAMRIPQEAFAKLQKTNPRVRRRTTAYLGKVLL